MGRFAYANDNFYGGCTLLAGICFAVFQFSAITEGRFHYDIILWFLVSLLPGIVMCGLKAKRTNGRAQLFALSRPYRHIAADFILSMAITSAFSTVIYVYSNNLSIDESKAGVPTYMVYLIVDIALIFGSLFILSVLAGEERRMFDDARGD